MSLSSFSLLSPDPDRVWRDPEAKTLSFFCQRLPVKIDASVIRELIQLGTSEGQRNVRICLHESPSARHHDMIILEHSSHYYRPHRHIDKGECFHVLQGELGIFAFTNEGDVIEAVRLGVGDIYRVQPGMYHAVMPLSDMVIYHENKPGLFLRDKDSLYPDWAPNGLNAEEAQTYKRTLAGHFNK